MKLNIAVGAKGELLHISLVWAGTETDIGRLKKSDFIQWLHADGKPQKVILYHFNASQNG
jgi:hypothetical protein